MQVEEDRTRTLKVTLGDRGRVEFKIHNGKASLAMHQGRATARLEIDAGDLRTLVEFLAVAEKELEEW